MNTKTMKLMTSIVTLVLTFSIWAGPGTSGGTPTTYIDRDFGFKLIFPSKWSLTNIDRNNIRVSDNSGSKLELEVVESLFPDRASAEQKREILASYVREQTSENGSIIRVNDLDGISVKADEQQKELLSFLIFKNVVLRFNGRALDEEKYKIIVSIFRSTNLIDLIFKATKNGDTDFLQSVYDQGIIVHKVEVTGTAPLKWAIKFNQLEVVKLLHKNGESFKNKKTDALKALKMEDQSIVSYFLENGFDFNTLYEEFYVTGLRNRKVDYRFIHMAILHDKFETLKLLEQLGADLSEHIYFKNESKKYFIDALYLSLKERKLKIFEYLFAKEVNIQTLDFKSYSLIDQLLMNYPQDHRGLGYFENLLSLGAKFGEESRVPRFTRMIIRRGSEKYVEFATLLFDMGYDYETSLIDLTDKDNFDLIRRLVENGKDVNVVDDNGENLLTRVRSLSTARYLIARGIDVNHINHSGENVIHKIFYTSPIDYIGLLVQAGADLNFQDRNGNTIFHRFAKDTYVRDLKRIKSLMDMGANLNLFNKDGKTSIMMFPCKERRGYAYHYDRLDLFIKNGATLDFPDRNVSTVLRCAKEIKESRSGVNDVLKVLISVSNGIDVFGSRIWSTIKKWSVRRGHPWDVVEQHELFWELYKNGLNVNDIEENGNSIAYNHFSEYPIFYQSGDIKLHHRKEINYNEKGVHDGVPLYFLIFKRKFKSSKSEFELVDDFFKIHEDGVIDWKAKNNNGDSFLHYFLENRVFESHYREYDKYFAKILDYLLEKELSFNAINNAGAVPVMSLFKNPVLQNNHSVKTIMRIVLRNFSNLRVVDKKGDSLAHYAVKLLESSTLVNTLECFKDLNIPLGVLNYINQAPFNYLLENNNYQRSDAFSILLPYANLNYLDEVGNTIFHLYLLNASKHINVETMTFLKEEGVDFNSLNDNKESALSLFIKKYEYPYSYQDHIVEIIKLVSDFGVNLNSVDEGKIGLLSYISNFDESKLLEVLRLGANPNVMSSPISSVSFFYDQVRDHNISLVREMIDSVDNINETDPTNSGNISLSTVLYEESYEIAELLLRAGANPNHVNSDGERMKPKLKLLKLLIKYGYDINAGYLISDYLKDYEVLEYLLGLGLSPDKSRNIQNICLTIQTSKLEHTKLLIDYGAEISWIQKKNKKPMNILFCFLERPYWLPNNKDEIELYEYILSKNPPLNARYEKFDDEKIERSDVTALDLTFRDYPLSFSRKLIDMGAKLKIKGKNPTYWRNPTSEFLSLWQEYDQDLSHRIYHNNRKETWSFVHYLAANTDDVFRSLGFSFRDDHLIWGDYWESSLRELIESNQVEIEDRTEKGRTPLMIAARYCSLSTVKVLVESGAKVNAVDNDGKTAITMIGNEYQQRYRQKVIDYLIDNGAVLPSN